MRAKKLVVLLDLCYLKEKEKKKKWGHYIEPIYGKKKRSKISPCGLANLQLASCGIKMNSKVTKVCKKYNNNLVHIVKFHPLK
jgi:hypothetical protein